MRAKRTRFAGRGRSGSRRWALAIAALVGAVALVPALGGQASGVTAKKISAWIPNWDQARAYNSFMANADLYDEALPYWYEMQSPSSITAYGGAEDPTVIAGIRSTGVRLVPTIANAFDGARVSSMLSTAAGRTAHVQALVDLVQTKGYDGIDVDYENMASTDRTNFTSFVTQLASALHANGKVLDVAVYAKTSEPGTWAGPQSEDYAALGSVVDRLQLMTYDYHWDTSAAGPIAPLSWVSQVAAFAASKVSPSKVELGMNLYGYDWVGSNGQSKMWDEMESARTASGAARQWDATAAEPWFTYTAAGQSHTAYYGDAQSVSARLAVVDKYNLAGAAFWRLGGEDPAVWPTVRSHWTSTVSAPSAPRNLRVTGTAGSVTLSWTPPTAGPVTSYAVCRGSRGAETCMWTSSATSFTDTSAVLKTVYYYRVAAVNAAGQGLYSGEVSAKRTS
ncbi:MAG: fibronectin type III domain-containing protein [Acidimicrobiia bacterium]|nr:fibronectin type III domain-containing protein [Acidimicrobiia bacterium]